MFTGLITDVGEIVGTGNGSFTVATSYSLSDSDVGASICCDGVCLTVTSVAKENDKARFSVDVSNETASKSNLGEWKVGRKINLERSLSAGDELGGHIVSGHVDGVATILDITPDGESQRIQFEAPEHLARYIAPKGSVALDGTSLTINEVVGTRFGINLIPHSLSVTTWETKKPGDRINLEVDVLARYVARLMQFEN